MTEQVSLDQASFAQLNPYVQNWSAESRDAFMLGLEKASNMGSVNAGKLAKDFRDCYGTKDVDPATAFQHNLIGDTPPGAGPPDAAYSQQKTQVASAYTVPLETSGTIKGTKLTGKQLKNTLEQGLKSDKPEVRASAKRVMNKYNVQVDQNGAWRINAENLEGGAAGLSTLPGAQNQVAESIANSQKKLSWMLPVMNAGMFLMNPIGGLMMMPFTATAMKSGFSLGSVSSALGASAAGSPSGYFGDLGSMTTTGVAATAAQAAGFEGLAMNLRHQMSSYVRSMENRSMMSMLQNPGIPIEDLIFYFMAFMGDKYEQKLREKMEEAVMAEQKEERRNRETKQAEMFGGMLSAIPVVGTALGSIYQMGAQEKIRVQDALDGNTKSSTILNAEVQMLMQKWKQHNEMLSNLMKALHDMAMTPIRNIR